MIALPLCVSKLIERWKIAVNVSLKTSIFRIFFRSVRKQYECSALDLLTANYLDVFHVHRNNYFNISLLICNLYIASLEFIMAEYNQRKGEILEEVTDRMEEIYWNLFLALQFHLGSQTNNIEPEPQNHIRNTDAF